jgi:hypothetical protein
VGGKTMHYDKRKYTRAKFDCEIMFPTIIYNDRKKTIMDNSHHMYAVDISEAGICVQSNFPIYQDNFISFYLRIGENIPFKVLIKVRWNTISDNSYLSGGEFVALNLEDIHILRNYVNSQR